jgi:hypothetical protein
VPKGRPQRLRRHCGDHRAKAQYDREPHRTDRDEIAERIMRYAVSQPSRECLLGVVALLLGLFLLGSPIDLYPATRVGSRCVVHRPRIPALAFFEAFV